MSAMATPKDHPGAAMNSGQQGLSPYERIKQGILDATLLPGQPLTEQALAQWCGVSRTPIREALVALSQDGMIERRSRAFYVRVRSPEEILDIYEVRITLEASAARLAAERYNKIDRIRIEQMLAAWNGLDEGADGTLLAHTNRAFHQAIWTAAHSPALSDLLTRLNLHLARYPATTLTVQGRWRTALQEHQDLTDAILGRDVERAGRLAEAHFTAARDVRLALWEQDTI
jgi:DNA-binding GntR family transcriptional regulator